MPDIQPLAPADILIVSWQHTLRGADDKSRDDGRTRWTMNGQAFKGLFAGLTLSELCALYFSRTLLESLAGTPFREDLGSAFDKLATSLTPHMRQFLDQLQKPDCDYLEGLSPTIAIEQRNAVRTARSSGSSSGLRRYS